MAVGDPRLVAQHELDPAVVLHERVEDLVGEQVLGRGPDEVTGGVSAWYDVDARARRVELGLTTS